MSGTARTWFPLTGPVLPKHRPAIEAVQKGPIDPLTGPKLALAGRVVTMDNAFTLSLMRSCMPKKPDCRSPGTSAGASARLSRVSRS